MKGKAILTLIAVGALAAGGADGSASDPAAGGTILYVLNPQQQAQLLTVAASPPYRRRNLGLSGVLDAAFAPNGRTIYALRRPRGQPTADLIRMNLDGSRRRLLRRGLTPGSASFALAPDAASVAFYSATGAGSIVLATLDGATRTLARDVTARSVAWSADGRTIYFAGWSRTKPEGCWSSDFCALNLRSGKLRTVGPVPLHVHANIDGDISLSPDGRRLAFSTVAGPAALAVIGTSGRHFRRIVVDPTAFSPLWSPAGDSIAYRENARGIAVTNLVTHSTRIVARYTGAEEPRLLAWKPPD